MAIKGIDHVGIAVHSIEEALKFYRDILGLEVEKTELMPQDGIRVCSLRVGNCKIELLEPTDPDSGVGKFLARSGRATLHHICIEVENIEEELSDLDSRGVELIDKKARKGLHAMVGFVHPRAADGVLLELSQGE